ncbi:hypothetical protein BO78DRAFT_288333, partial [Aspergillus sclerotiicarbonarius CBS 121057]
PCEHGCGSLLFPALDSALVETSYTNVSANSLLRGGFQALECLIDPIEQLSLCETCPKELAYRDYYHTICDGIVRQYKHFYQVLFRRYKQIDYEINDDDVERHDFILLQYAFQIDRILSSIIRVTYILKEQHVYDEDSWYMVHNQAERLANATYNLRERVV